MRAKSGLTWKQVLLALACSLLILAGCGRKTEQETGKDATKPAAAQTVLATVSGKPITQAQFDAYLQFKRLTPRDDEQRRTLWEQYLEREKLAAAVENAGVLDKALAAAELNEFRKEMLLSRYFEKFLQQTVTDEAIENYYKAHPTEFEEHKAHLAHILVRMPRNPGDLERKAKQTTIQAAYSQLKTGRDFAAVATEYSEDSNSASKGGDLGWLKEGTISPRFSDIAFKLEPGQYSEPFETEFGFHIVKLLDTIQVIRRPLEAVRGDIRYRLRNEAKAAELKRLLGEPAPPDGRS